MLTGVLKALGRGYSQHPGVEVNPHLADMTTHFRTQCGVQLEGVSEKGEAEGKEHKEGTTGTGRRRHRHEETKSRAIDEEEERNMAQEE